MPEICRFFGIIIRMFVETGGVHHKAHFHAYKAHFHAYYEQEVGIYGIDPIVRLAANYRIVRSDLSWLGRNFISMTFKRIGILCRKAGLLVRLNH